MRLRTLLVRGTVVGCALALLPAQAALAAAPGAAKPSAAITTEPSAMIGGLPETSLDGRTAYIPATAAGPAGAGSAARGARAATHGGTPATGYDISWPECGKAMPPSSQISIVGVDDGHPFSQNPCLRQEAAWASSAKQRAQYMVLDSPVGWTSAHVLQYAYHGPAGDCGETDYACQSFNWGYNAAYADVQYADSQGATGPQWWLDVELPTSSSIDPSGPDCYTANFWICDPEFNSVVILAAVAGLKAQGKQVGVYSTRSQWKAITGGLPLGLPIWIAGYDYPATAYCDPADASAYWFALGAPRLVQSLPAAYDPDTHC